MDIQRTRSFLPLKELAEKVLTGVEGINTLDDSLLNGIISAREVIKIDELVKTLSSGTLYPMKTIYRVCNVTSARQKNSMVVQI